MPQIPAVLMLSRSQNILVQILMMLPGLTAFSPAGWVRGSTDPVLQLLFSLWGCRAVGLQGLATEFAGAQLRNPLPRSWLIFPENLRRRAKSLHTLVAAVLPDLLAVAKACVNVAKWSIITRYIQCPLPCR